VTARAALDRHLVDMLNQPTDARQFSNWSFALAVPAGAVLQQIANEHCAMTVSKVQHKQEDSPGLALLLDLQINKWVVLP
jgi:hypothetical protein